MHILHLADTIFFFLCQQVFQGWDDHYTVPIKISGTCVLHAQYICTNHTPGTTFLFIIIWNLKEDDFTTLLHCDPWFPFGTISPTG